MKKIFIALMAVCVMASCGGSSEKKANPGQVFDKIISSTETLLNKAERAIRAEDPEIIVSAFEKYADQMADIYNKYGDMMSNMSSEEQEKYYDKAVEMVQLMGEVQDLEDDLNQLGMDATPSQERRMQKALEKLEMFY